MILHEVGSQALNFEVNVACRKVWFHISYLMFIINSKSNMFFFLFFFSKVCLLVRRSREGISLYTSQTCCHTHFMSHGEAEELQLSAISPDETPLWKDIKTVQTCHRQSGCFIPDQIYEKVPLISSVHSTFWEHRCKISTSHSLVTPVPVYLIVLKLNCCSWRNVLLFVQWNCQPYKMPDGHLTMCCKPRKYDVVRCVIHGLMSDSHKPLCSSDDYTFVSPGIRCSAFRHMNTHTEAHIQFTAIPGSTVTVSYMHGQDTRLRPCVLTQPLPCAHFQTDYKSVLNSCFDCIVPKLSMWSLSSRRSKKHNSNTVGVIYIILPTRYVHGYA